MGKSYKVFLTHTVQMKLGVVVMLALLSLIGVLNPHGSDETRNHYF